MATQHTSVGEVRKYRGFACTWGSYACRQLVLDILDKIENPELCWIVAVFLFLMLLPSFPHLGSLLGQVADGMSDLRRI